MKKKLKITLAILISFVFILYSNIWIKRLVLKKNDKYFCDPIFKNSKQFYVNIDGENYPKIVTSFFNTSINFKCLNTYPKTKLILLWNDYGPWVDYKYGLGKILPFRKKNCPVYNCEVTRNRTRINEADLILINMRGDLSNLPLKRSPLTRLVFLITESPIHSKELHSYNRLFNLTATYNFNSDFSPFYYSNIGFKWEENKKFDLNKNYLYGKSKLAAILVTNCNAHSKRIEYVKEMQKYAQIDIIGGCGISCNITNENRFLSKKCRENISKQYKFFLAFENSFCEDYITEKFFDTLLYDIIPVVLGKGPYEKWIPKSAYINALDFKSPKHLTEYLLYLSKNSSAYNSYFKWKKHIKITNNEYKTFCDMCIKLQLENYFGVKEAVLNNIENFWGYKKNCLTPVINNGVFRYIPINYTHKCKFC